MDIDPKIRTRETCLSLAVEAVYRSGLSVASVLPIADAFSTFVETGEKKPFDVSASQNLQAKYDAMMNRIKASPHLLAVFKGELPG